MRRFDLVEPFADSRVHGGMNNGLIKIDNKR